MFPRRQAIRIIEKIKCWIPLVRDTNYVDYPKIIGHGLVPDMDISFTFEDFTNPEVQL